VNVLLRPATQSDIPYLLALRKDVMDEHLRNSGASTSEDEHLKRLMYGFEHAQVLEVNGRPIGLMKLARKAPTWELIQIQLDSSYRGTGLGTQLLWEVIEEAAENGCDVQLSVLKANPARSLYERLGFEVVGQDEHEYHMHRRAAIHRRDVQ